MSDEKFISRDEACAVLFDLINSGILDKDIEDSLQEISYCIEQEEAGYHAWGADNEITMLNTAYREDLWTDELKDKMRSISDKYSFTPAPYEAEEFDSDESEE